MVRKSKKNVRNWIADGQDMSGNTKNLSGNGPRWSGNVKKWSDNGQELV